VSEGDLRRLCGSILHEVLQRELMSAPETRLLNELQADTVADRLRQASADATAAMRLTPSLWNADPVVKQREVRETRSLWLQGALQRASGSEVQFTDLTKKRLADLEQRTTEQFAFTPAIGTSGGLLVPDDWRAELIRTPPQPIGVLDIITVRETNRETYTLPTSTTPTVQRGAAAAAAKTNVDNTRLTAQTLTAGIKQFVMQYFAARMDMKLDMLSDTPLNLFAEITAMLNEEFTTERDRSVLIGAGHASQEPQGVMTDANIPQLSLGAAINAQCVNQIFYELPARYRVDQSRIRLLVSSAAARDLRYDLATTIRNLDILQFPDVRESVHLSPSQAVVGNWAYYYHVVNRLMHLVTSVHADEYAQKIAVVEKHDGGATRYCAFLRIADVTYSNAPTDCTADA